MKNIKLIISLMSVLALTSCDGGITSFYGKTFTYKGTVSYNLSSKDYTLQKSYESIIKEQMTLDNIDWDKSGYVSGWSVEPFSDHSSYSAMIAEMERNAKTTFDSYFTGFSLKVASYQEKTASFTYKGETKNVTLQGYNDDTEGAYYLYMKENDESIGYFTMATYTGASCVNGHYSCIEFSYNSVINRLKCTISFKTAVYDTSSITWLVYGTINN